MKTSLTLKMYLQVGAEICLSEKAHVEPTQANHHLTPAIYSHHVSMSFAF